MIRNFYNWLGRTLFRLIAPFWKKYAKKPRARLLVVSNDSVLLIKNWLSEQRWKLPGGGIKAGETALKAAIREAREELGIKLSENQLKLIYEDTVKSKISYKAVVFAVNYEAESIKPHSRELIEAKSFKFDRLPADRSSVVDIAIANYRGDVDKKRARG